MSTPSESCSHSSEKLSDISMDQILDRDGFDPSSDFVQETHRISAWSSILILFLAPVITAFDVRQQISNVGWAALVVVHTVADLIFIGNSIISALSGYYVANDKGEKIILVNKLRKNISYYLQFYFIIDFLTSIPVK